MTKKSNGHSSRRFVGYVRVSLEKQAERGVSLAAQEERIHSYAKLYELEVVALVKDPGASAKTLERPGLIRALKLLETNEADGLLVAKLDRLTRRVTDLGTLLEDYFQDGHHALLSVEENLDTRTAGGRMFLSMMTVLSQWERETIGERTAAALAHLKTQGVKLGRAPYGYVRVSNREFQEVPHEQKVINLVHALRAKRYTVVEIAEMLQAKGYPTRKAGGRWHATQVVRIINRAG